MHFETPILGEHPASTLRRKECRMLGSVCNNVEKSPFDKRTYRAFVLPNKLKVLLVCDKDSDKAAAALNVSVGLNSDPKERGGLAHFCEHMLFLGSDKYPEESALDKHVSAHGGSSNAGTSEENTAYHFHIATTAVKGKSESQKQYWEGVDRFAQMFDAPLFLESGVEREAKAVSSEFEKGPQSDEYRIYQLLKSVSNPRSSFHNFACGNLETLGKPDTREALIQFHNVNYSANIMNLVMVTPFDLDVLQDYAVKLFSSIKSKNMPGLSTGSNPIFRQSDLGRMYRICPVQDLRSLQFVWAIESSRSTYKWKPDRYIAGLLGYEGQRSLLSMLKRRGWAVGINVGTLLPLNMNDLFRVDIELTKKGLGYIDEITELFHGYLNFIKRDCVQEWIYEEYKAVADLQFQFVERRDAERLAVALARSIARYGDPQLCLKAPKLFVQYSEESIRKVLLELVPDKILILAVAKKFGNDVSEKERWYKTPYSVENIPKEKLEQWAQAPITEEMVLRSPNKFIPTNFDVLGKGIEIDDTFAGPECLASEESFKMYYKLDQTFLIPKASVHLQLLTPRAYDSPRFLVLSTLYKSLLCDLLAEHVYDARVAGLQYSVHVHYYGIEVVVKGFSHHLEELLLTVLDRMKNLTIEADRFLMIKDDVRLQYEMQHKATPAENVREVVGCVLERKWHVRSLLEEIDSADLTLEAVNCFIPVLFERMNIQCLIHGSVSREWATNLSFKVKRILKITPLRKVEVSTRRTTKLPQKSTCMYGEVAINSEENNSAIEIHYQVGAVGNDTVTAMAVEILSMLIEEPFYSELRTKQQLGYMVGSYIRCRNNVTGISFDIQSSVTDPDDLESRIEEYIDDFGHILSSTPEGKFSEFINAAKAMKLKRDENLTERSSRYWKEIREFEYMWDRKEKEVEALDSLTLNDVKNVYSNCVLRNGKDRRKLVVKIYGGSSDVTKCRYHDEAFGIETLVIKDVVKFRESMAQWPASGKLGQEEDEEY